MNTATQKQIDLLKRLTTEKVLDERALSAVKVARAAWTAGMLTSKVASTTIDLLFACPRRAVAVGTVAPEGMHVVDGTVYKVQVAKNGSGNQYAKCLNKIYVGEDGRDRWSFEYAPGAVRLLNESTVMSAEQAASFGALYGICCSCNKDLTDETSIYHGYGEKCAANNGWAYDRKAARQAEAIARVTGATGATVTYETRHLDGTLTTDAVGTWVRV